MYAARGGRLETLDKAREKFQLSVEKLQQPAVQVEGENGWGQAVEGIQVRLRAERQMWYDGEVPRFLVDIRNRGARKLKLAYAIDYLRIEVDKVWYRATIPLLGDVKIYSLGPDNKLNLYSRMESGCMRREVVVLRLWTRPGKSFNYQ